MLPFNGNGVATEIPVGLEIHACFARFNYFYLSGGTVFLVEHNGHYTLKAFGASPLLFSSLLLTLMLSTSTRTLHYKLGTALSSQYASRNCFLSTSESDYCNQTHFSLMKWEGEAYVGMSLVTSVRCLLFSHKTMRNGHQWSRCWRKRVHRLWCEA